MGWLWLVGYSIGGNFHEKKNFKWQWLFFPMFARYLPLSWDHGYITHHYADHDITQLGNIRKNQAVFFGMTKGFKVMFTFAGIYRKTIGQ